MNKQAARFLRDASGATVIEYCLIAAFIALAVIVGVAAVGQSAKGWYEDINAGIEGS